MTMRQVYFRPRDLAGLEGVHAMASRHRFPRHVHPELVVGLVLDGAKDFEIDGRPLRVGAGSAFVIPPDVVHTGASAECGASYLAWFVPAKLLGGHQCPQDPWQANERLGRDKEFRVRVLALDHSVEHHSTLLDRESCLEAVLSRVGGGTAIPAESAVSAGLRRAFDYLQVHFAEKVPLKVIAEQANLSRFHFLRRFRDAYHLTPAAYLDSLRIRQAKIMLADGQAPADVAPAVGYSDQAHLTRRMKRLSSLTPGQIARGQQ